MGICGVGVCVRERGKGGAGGGVTVGMHFGNGVTERFSGHLC